VVEVDAEEARDGKVAAAADDDDDEAAVPAS
jgi:hypothetical protein